MRPGVVFVLDDAIEVPSDIHSMTGIGRFGDLIHRRRRLHEWTDAAAAAAGFTERLRLEDTSARRRLAERLEASTSPTRFVFATSDVVGLADRALERFLHKLAYADRDVATMPEGSGPGSCLAGLSKEALRRLLLAPTRRDRQAVLADETHPIEPIEAGPDLRCIADSGIFNRFLSGSFIARSFNAVHSEGRTVLKTSTDPDKLRREHDYWYLLPPNLQRFVVQPFDFETTPQGGCYRMERLNVPDLAVLWIHGRGALSDEELGHALDAVFDWFAQRPVRRVPAAEAEAAARALYIDKVRQRRDRLLATEVGRKLDAMIAHTTGWGGVSALIDRYETLLEASWKDGIGDQIAVMHGDLCFSNILYDKRSRLMKLVDPRGAAEANEIWGDPYYDVAKLSHSVLGGYDFINNGLFELTVDDDLGLTLRLHEGGQREAGNLFRQRVEAAGFDVGRMRLYEASLFLSMLPLHAEDPRKLAGFVVRAGTILDEVASADTRPRSVISRMLG